MERNGLGIYSWGTDSGPNQRPEKGPLSTYPMRMLCTTDYHVSCTLPFPDGCVCCGHLSHPTSACARKEPWLFSPLTYRARGATSRPGTKSWYPAQMGPWQGGGKQICVTRGWAVWYNMLLFKNLCFPPQRKSVLPHPLTQVWLCDLLQAMACECQCCLSPLGHTWFSRLSSSSAVTAITGPDVGWAALLNHRT